MVMKKHPFGSSEEFWAMDESLTQSINNGIKPHIKN
jgi:hypothetical protein